MQGEVTVTLDMTATTNTRSVSEDVAVPPWANTVSIFPRASSWGSGPAATVTLKDSARGRSGYDGLSGAVTFTSSTPQRRIDVRGSERLRFETTTAAGSGADEDAEFRLVFSDVAA